MNEKHAQNVPNVKPGVLLCNPRFDEFNADDVFVKDSKNPETYGVGKWWGGDGAFWDFTKPEGRTAWKKYLTDPSLPWAPILSGTTTASTTA